VKLTQETVVRTALTLLDEVGLDGLTLRKIAERLDVQAPALYWHVKNKRDLIDLMASMIFRDAMAEFTPPAERESWVDWLAQGARGYREMMHGHRDGARVLSGAYTPEPALNRWVEFLLRTLTDAGFSLDDALKAVLTVTSYVSGYVIEEQAASSWPEERRVHVDPALFPLMSAAGRTVREDSTFEYGLQLMLTGLRLARLGQ
jgi:TetR/AcrR family transcriptional regulator, tetracycline repressor protein